MNRLSSRASIVLILLFSNPLAAQTRTGTIVGVVKDSLGNAIPNVEVTAIKIAKAVRSDTAGRFVLNAVPAGSSDFSFRRLAFEPAVLIITVPAADTAEVEVTLGVAAQRLTAVVIQDHPAQLRQLVAFETRRKQGIGHFITRSQIEDRHPYLLSDMVRMIPGTILVSADNGRTALRFSRVARNNCPPQFFVDGIQVTGFSIDDMPPGDVEGVELYAGASGLPPEYNRVHGTSICGTVIIWTKVPSTAKGDTAKP